MVSPREAGFDKETFRRELEEFLSPQRVLHRAMDLEPYRYDAYFIEGTPDYVVFPLTTEEVAACVQAARRAGLAIVPRGAGTCLSGGPVDRFAAPYLTYLFENAIYYEYCPILVLVLPVTNILAAILPR